MKFVNQVILLLNLFLFFNLSAGYFKNIFSPLFRRTTQYDTNLLRWKKEDPRFAEDIFEAQMVNMHNKIKWDPFSFGLLFYGFYNFSQENVYNFVVEFCNHAYKFYEKEYSNVSDMIVKCGGEIPYATSFEYDRTKVPEVFQRHFNKLEAILSKKALFKKIIQEVQHDARVAVIKNTCIQGIFSVSLALLLAYRIKKLHLIKKYILGNVLILDEFYQRFSYSNSFENNIYGEKKVHYTTYLLTLQDVILSEEEQKSIRCVFQLEEREEIRSIMKDLIFDMGHYKNDYDKLVQMWYGFDIKNLIDMHYNDNTKFIDNNEISDDIKNIMKLQLAFILLLGVVPRFSKPMSVPVPILKI